MNAAATYRYQSAGRKTQRSAGAVNDVKTIPTKPLQEPWP
jgi:hypothetical protein